DAQPFKIFEDFGGEVVLFFLVLASQVLGCAALAGFARIGARGMEERAAGAAGAVDDVFGEHLKIVGVVVIFVADDVDESAPSVAYADDLVALAKCAVGDAANGGIQPGHVAASGENPDDALLGANVSHVCAPVRVKLNR